MYEERSVAKSKLGNYLSTYCFIYLLLQRYIGSSENHIEKLFAEKPKKLSKNDIFKLRDRWRKSMGGNDVCII